MTYNEEVRAKETPSLIADICGSHCEVVDIDGESLLYVDGRCLGKLFEEETPEDYISQIEEIME